MRWSLLVVMWLGLAGPARGTEVVGRLNEGTSSIIACGTIAFIGVYVYTVEKTLSGPPVGGEIVVDVLCPDFYVDKVKFAVGQRHRLVLGPAKKEYARATPPKSPRPDLPRFEATKVSPP
jgi:hypothetical protein